MLKTCKVVYDMDEVTYRKAEGVSKSDLDFVHVEPELLQWREFSSEVDLKREALDFGDLFHKYFLQPELFKRDYAVEPDTRGMIDTVDELRGECDRLGVTYKKTAPKSELIELLRGVESKKIKTVELETFNNGLKGRTIVKCEEYRRVMDMGFSIQAHPIAMELFSRAGSNEVSFFVKAEGDHCIRKCRADRVCDEGFIVDLKTTRDVDKLQASIVDYRYYVQAAYYSDIIEACTGVKREFVFVFVGTTPVLGRYPVRVGKLPEFLLEKGREEYRDDLQALKEYQDFGSKGVKTFEGFERFFRYNTFKNVENGKDF